MSGLQIYLLGSFQSNQDGQSPTSFGYDKVRALLAFLAIENDSAHKRDALAGLLWPDQTESAAHDSLRNALARLRHAIRDTEADPPYLLVTKDSLQFNPACDHWLDVQRFTDLLDQCHTHHHRRIEACPTCTDRLIEAADLYHGEFLHGFSLPDSDPFEDWLRIKREKYKSRAVEALQTLSSTFEWCNQPAKALTFAQKLLELDPCREDSYVSTMRLYANQALRSEACAQYDKCQKILADELGLEPTEPTTRLYEQIKYGLYQPSSSRLPRINNLPANLTSFVGREQELSEIDALIQDPNCHLLTLVGPGGVGKTRLAIAAAARQQEIFRNGVCFASLARTSSVAGIVPIILQALNLKSAKKTNLRAQLIDFLREKELVLVLDNFEHLLHGAKLINEILQDSPGLMVLVTSRQRLGLQAEWIFEVNGLGYPSGGDARNLRTYEAVQLFIQRLHQLNPRHTLVDDDLLGVLRICRAVEGMPLGIEMAATSVKMRTIEQVAQAIESGTEDLKSSWKDIPERHRNLIAVFDYSYRILSEREQKAFCALSIFSGGFTANAAEHVAGSTSDMLESFVEKSLVRYDPLRECYSLHELIRQYAALKLNSQWEKLNIPQRYCNYFMRALERWDNEQQGKEQIQAYKKMDDDLPNIQHAWRLACQSGYIDELSRGWLGLFRYYLVHSRVKEGEYDRELALEMLDSIDNLNVQGRRLKARLLLLKVFWSPASKLMESPKIKTLQESLSIINDLQEEGEDVRWEYAWIFMELSKESPDAENAAQLAQHSLEISNQIENKRAIAFSLWNLANIYFDNGDFKKAEYYSKAGFAEFRLMGDTRRTAEILIKIVEITAYQGKINLALQTAQDAYKLLQSLGDPISYASSLIYRGWVYRLARSWSDAEKLYTESLDYYREFGDLGSMSLVTSNLSSIKLYSGKYEEARVIAEKSLDLANQAEDTASLMYGEYILGELYLAQDQLEMAILSLVKARNYTILYRLYLHTGEASGALSLAYIKNDDLVNGLKYLVAALQQGTDLHSYTNISFALPAAALLAAHSGQVDRAVELCGLIDEKAMCGRTPWFEDVAGKEIKEMAKSLPPEAVGAAYERGRQLDLFETAAHLLEEFKGEGFDRRNLSG